MRMRVRILSFNLMRIWIYNTASENELLFSMVDKKKSEKARNLFAIFKYSTGILHPYTNQNSEVRRLIH